MISTTAEGHGLGRSGMEIDNQAIEALRLKLRYKVRYHLGSYCPDIDDVVQETLSRLLEAARADRIRNPGSLGAFASATCNNVIHEYRRGLWREAPYEQPELPEQPVRPVDAEALETRNLVAQTLAELPERDRWLLTAFYLEEKTPEQISEETGLTAANMRVALFRARERFRKISGDGMKSIVSGRH
jgi:RNA polymerase sigma factor (sigma-70 family)